MVCSSNLGVILYNVGIPDLRFTFVSIHSLKTHIDRMNGTAVQITVLAFLKIIDLELKLFAI